jgi:hypothetical protein
MENKRLNWRLLWQRIIFTILGGGLILYALWPWLPFAQGAPQRTIVLYGFSILGEVMNEGVFPAFAAEWEAQTGEQVEFISAFASSGTITNQMIMGVPAEVAILSLELDALRLVEMAFCPVLPGKRCPMKGWSTEHRLSFWYGRITPNRSTTLATWPGPVWALFTPTR